MQCKQDIPQHNEFIFTLSPQRQVHFSSNFDSGNCGNITMLSNTEFYIDTSPDFDSTSKIEGLSKSWFYFSVRGLQVKTKFHIFRLKMLYSLWSNGNGSSYRPVFRVGQEGEFQRLKKPVSFEYEEKENVLRLIFSFDFSKTQDKEVYFAFSYPYSYQRNIDYINQLSLQYSNDEDIYFHKETITYTPQLRQVNLLTISSHDNKTDQHESFFGETLFPERQFEKRALKFKQSKPIILISARVHPGETPASFALEGLINFLLNKKDLRSFLLRKYFQFWIVPMLNPDGVYCGHYRMDIYNQNLNRFYQVANNSKQPSIYAMKKMINQISLEGRLFFYMDFHSHAGKKGAFLYGNAIEEFSQQVESQVFAKIMSLNDPYFEYNYCNFSKSQMKAKDRQDDLTKEGCGRVFVYQSSKIIHSYTLECGFHHATQINSLTRCQNSDFKVKVEDKEFELIERDKQFNNSANIESKNTEGINFFTPQMFEETGKAVLISLLDVYEKNPYSRISSSQYSSIDNIRKEIAIEVARSDRMRQEVAQSYSKAKNIINLIYDNFFSKIDLMMIFDLKEKIEWPLNIRDEMTKKYTGQNLLQQNNSNSSRKIKQSIKQRVPNRGFKWQRNQNNNSIGGAQQNNSGQGQNQLTQSFEIETNFIPIKRNQNANEQQNNTTTNILKNVLDESSFVDIPELNDKIGNSNKNQLQNQIQINSNMTRCSINDKEQSNSITNADQNQIQANEGLKKYKIKENQGNVVIVIGSINQTFNQQDKILTQQGNGMQSNKFKSRQRCLTDYDFDDSNLNQNDSISQLTLFSKRIQSPPSQQQNSNEQESRKKLLSIINQKSNNTLSLNNGYSLSKMLNNQLSTQNGSQNLNTDQSSQQQKVETNPLQNTNIGSQNEDFQQVNTINNEMLSISKNQQKSPFKQITQRPKGNLSCHQDSMGMLSELITQVKKQIAVSYYQQDVIFNNEKSKYLEGNSETTQASIREQILSDNSIQAQPSKQFDSIKANSRKVSKCNQVNQGSQKPYLEKQLSSNQQQNTETSCSSNSSSSNQEITIAQLGLQQQKIDIKQQIKQQQQFHQQIQEQQQKQELIQQSSQNQQQILQGILLQKQNNSLQGANDEDEYKKVLNQETTKADKQQKNIQYKDENKQQIDKMKNYFKQMNVKQRQYEKQSNSQCINYSSKQLQNQINENQFQQIRHRNSLTPTLIPEKCISQLSHHQNSGGKIKKRKNHSQENKNLINRTQRMYSTKTVNVLKQNLSLKTPSQQLKQISQYLLTEQQIHENSTNLNEYLDSTYEAIQQKDQSNILKQQKNQYMTNVADLSNQQIDDLTKKINFQLTNAKNAITQQNKGNNATQYDRQIDAKIGVISSSNCENTQLKTPDTKLYSDLFRPKNHSSVSPPLKFIQPQQKYQMPKQIQKIACQSVNEFEITNQINSNLNLSTPYNAKIIGASKSATKSKQPVLPNQINLSPEKYGYLTVNPQNKTLKLPNLKLKLNVDQS